MKKLIIFALVAAISFITACGAEVQGAHSGVTEEGSVSEAEATLLDWIAGSNFGIVSGGIDEANKTVSLAIPHDKYEALGDMDKRDIETAVVDILSYYLLDTAGEYVITYQVDNETIAESKTSVSNQSASSGEGDAVNLIFIHHSCGENWLNDGLNIALNDNGYHVADTYYGWREYGDNTDTADWPVWFQESVMQLVYQDLGTMTARNSIEAAPGENTIIMFKSCYPNSDVGAKITDEMKIYNELLPYFEQHPDKMFILVTPPPMIKISHPAKTRELCNWLCDRESGWLSGLTTGNVFVFDFYNVLTHPDAHHCYRDGEEVHEMVDGDDTLYYDSDGDDHPNSEGNEKAAQEFIELLNYWYGEFSIRQN